MNAPRECAKATDPKGPYHGMPAWSKEPVTLIVERTLPLDGVGHPDRATSLLPLLAGALSVAAGASIAAGVEHAAAIAAHSEHRAAVWTVLAIAVVQIA